MEYQLNTSINELDTYELNVNLPEQAEYTANLVVDFRPSKTSELINDSGFITSSYVGNGALTIQKNGVTIGSFTANQSTNQTVNIEADTQVKADWTATSGVAEILHKPDLTIYATNTALSEGLATKQDTISDLNDIRAGADLGATSLQPNDNITQLTNNAGYITKSVNNLDNYMLTSNINTALGEKVNTTDIINNVTTTTTNQALSANMGKELQDQINNLKQRGRYLSIWNCTTGLATTIPTVNPYTYKAGDYFIVGVTGATNYRPNGSTYDKDVSSTTVETGDVQVNDTYYYDGSTWSLLHTAQPTVAFETLAGSPYDNANLTTALNAKVTSNNAITGATKTKITYDNKGLVTGGSDLVASDIPDISATYYLATNPSGFITGITSSDVTTALGYTPYNSTNPSGYQNATQVNTAVTSYHDSTKYDASNPNGYTSNTGTVTSVAVKMNGSTKGTITTSGTIDLGTVITSHQDISGKENTSNKVTSISSASTNTQYPSAKCVYDIVGNIEATLQAIRGV